MSRDNKFLKVFREENSPEYEIFKKISDEDTVVRCLIESNRNLIENPKILDIGGRNGNMSRFFQQNPDLITIIDPDPVLRNQNIFGQLISKKIQDFNLEHGYDLIIASHVWGDIGRDGDQKQILEKLFNTLNDEGILVLVYNLNTDFMADLLDFAKANLNGLRYDYFDENFLNDYKLSGEITFNTPLKYLSFEELSRACWFLFGTGEQDIVDVANSFLPYLKDRLEKPFFDLVQRFILIRK